MRRLSLTPGANGSDVRMSAAGILFFPHLRLSARQAVENSRIARLIEAAGESVLLEEADYQVLRNAVETFEGYSREDLTLITRVLEAPEVEVSEVV